ncbi:ATP/maltotriose-dependent transcriptional regulator MalT [Kribbella amoyensis]|uniref:ATP/maltotriose-dependent transcriptional regulator MalT n=1 Tax=Kribbella amoyensis TaxID=996641 RepID=A0A561B368_9ACTN|nr:helix-turn-helix domain-containing protein [Kribbella amoyensis]TWD73305.1 ATP/maltotriose-dependent transcriptional regulator MalT [Kribbella amoyensis]
MESQFAALLRRHRIAAGLTQDELSILSGISVQAISTLERGTRRYPQLSTVRALAGALRLDPDQKSALDAAASRRGRAKPRSPAAEATEPPESTEDETEDETEVQAVQEAAEPGPPQQNREAVSPRQLPFASGDFTGREQEIEDLRRYLSASPGVSVTTITGMGGIGKTSLAVQVAHRVAEHYPDGQLYLDLRGFGLGPPMEPLEALTYLLEDLGEVPPVDLPTAAARYRTALAERRLVLLLDNAANHQQVRPLLPGSGGCAVLVTSRRSLTGLGGRQFYLGEPPLHESIDMFRRISGRYDAPADDCAEVVRQCGGLPLAIRMAGARLASRPSWPVAHLAERLADGRRRLDELQLDDSGVRATLNLSIEQLAGSDDPTDVQAVSLFAMLGLAAAVDLSAPLAAALAQLPEPEAATVLERLVDVHLLTTPGPGRYRLHDLVRVAAREFAEQTLTEDERRAATTRWLQRVAAVVWKASEFAGHGLTRERWLDPGRLDAADDLPRQEDVLSWLDHERPALVPTIQQAVRDHPGLAVQLAVGLNAYYARRRAWLDWLLVTEAVLPLVEEGADRIAEGLVLHDLGAAHAELNQYDEAVAPLRRAVAAADASGDENLQSLCLSSLSHVLERAGRSTEGIPYAARAREIGLRLGVPARAAWACLALGMLHLRTGAAETAERLFAEALDLLPDPGQRRQRGLVAQNVGVAYREAGQYSLADRALRHGVELYRAAGADVQEAVVLTELARLRLAEDSLDSAARHLGQALAIAGQHGDRICEADVRRLLGETLHRQGELADARREWRLAYAIHTQHAIPIPADLQANLEFG